MDWFYQYRFILYATCFIFLATVYRVGSKRSLPLPDLDWLNVKPEQWFSKSRARLRTTFNLRPVLVEAYEKYSKHSRSCILPSLGKDVVLLPIDSIPWLISLPDSVLDSLSILKSQLQTDHTFPEKRIVDDPTHHATIRGELTRQVSNLVTDIHEEIAAAFEDEWGTDTLEWREVCVYETMIRIVARASNRVFVGLPLCRNETMLQAARSWAQAIPIVGTIILSIPPFLRYAVAPMLMYPVNKYVSAYDAALVPEVVRRQCRIAAEKDPKPNDFLQWTLDRADASEDPEERNPKIISHRLLGVNLAAIHTSTFSITSVIFDMVASGSANVATLVEESGTALKDTNGQWTKKILQQLIRHDSALRESARLGGIIAQGITRRVIAPEGITAPNGTFCPYDSYVAVPSWGVHHDPEIYGPDGVYQPFRYSDMRSGEKAPEASERGRQGLIKKANLSMVSLSPEYHPFGHGRHACPGRFFAANELKLILAIMLQTYEIDFDFLSERPPNEHKGPVMLPPMKATIRIRRKTMDGAR